ncbi:ABC transporter substrate-binding protein [Nitriliruptor alkaliphilus]|uniref:ABC transporter substrate-binding protein n=1 Tax=Nitriliruptor alkaliphilus TaxID=427918 RepID=UPI000698D247|nr:ABC transporter substrate-binding protein [Nitriliruptor alkaliphilus]
MKVGLLVAKSGTFAAVGRDMENGFTLYLEQNDNMLGGREVELVTVDEGETPQTGVAGVNRLVQQDAVDVLVGVVAGPTAIGGRDIFDSGQVPTLLANTGAVAFTDELASEWIWRTSQDNREPGQALAQKLAEDDSVGDVFLIAPDYSSGYEMLDGFKEHFPEDRVVGEVYTPFGTTSDFSGYLAQIRSSGADSIYSFFAGADAINFVTQYHQFGLADEVTHYSAGYVTDGPVLEAQGDTALGVFNSVRYNWDFENPENQAFVSTYVEKFDGLPTGFAASMYDTALILDRAISEVDGEVTRAAINEALGNIGTVSGVRGELSFDETRTIVQGWHLTEVQQTDDGLRNVTIEPLPNP